MIVLDQSLWEWGVALVSITFKQLVKISSVKFYAILYM